ncbi:NFACT family protein [Paenibacillus chartarius]|uniref:Rqc2 homolog RqcH n=1 Tax=Paenibacillus chartarius TaxID=747481 RepID=A0ABV6DTS4_9BACL
MALDGIVIHALVHELQAFVGGRIVKVHQPTDHDIVMQLRSQRQNAKLLLSANPTYPRLHITERSYTNPAEAPMFCMLLRKHCEGAVIERIEQVGMERIVRFRFKQRDELGDVSDKSLIVEIMGRHSNIILLDSATDTIIDGIHHVTPAISSYRIVMPGTAYTAPPEQNKANPLELNEERFDALWHGTVLGESAESRLVALFSGISPLIAKEVVFRAAGQANAGGVEPSPDAVRRQLLLLADDVRADRYAPQVAVDSRTGRMAFSVTELSHLSGAGGEVKIFASVSECLEAFYGEKAERDTVKQKTGDLLRFLTNERSKNVKKLEKLEQTLEESRDADKQRIYGELLNAHLHQLAKGDKEAEVVNYYEEEQPVIRIPLDPLLTPSENAQRYFKKYAKMRNSVAVIQEQLSETHDEIRYLDTLLQQLGAAALADIDEIRDELVEQGYLKERGRKQPGRKKKNGKPSLTRFESSEGVPLYVGKNNTQNEYLTNRFAQPNDTWLHTKDIPGSHVVIRGSEFGEATLHEAALLAAYFSQARESSQVPVDYTLIRHVHKPSGAKPGFVIYERQKTLYVTPDESLFKELAVRQKRE